MATRKPPQWHPRRRVWLGIGLMLLLAVAPHLWRLHPLAAAGWLAVVGWRLYLGLQQRRPPGLVPRLGLLVLATITLFIQHGTIVGRDAGAALLVMMLALKFLELHSQRDAMILVYLSYFLLCVQFLFTQNIPTALYLVASALVITTVWIEFSDPLGGRPLRQSFSLAGKLLLQALPLMLILFVLFPRIPGPLWRLPHDAHSGMTGLSNEMSPGQISRLVNSEAIAFRVTFNGEPPPPAQRYWRGPVFELSDGRRWVPAPQQSPRDDNQTLFRPQPLGTGIQQTITLEPHGKRSLLALDLPGHAIRNSTLQTDFQLVANTRVLERRRYSVTSYQKLDTGQFDTRNLEHSLFVPDMITDRVRALAKQWRAEAGTPEQIVAQALRFFNRENFVYTLTPPRLVNNPVDEFLFETRRGFCEHFSSSFVILMRAAGLPARVVTGYLGGEFNDVGDYLVVRQSDAHAWAEVWLSEQGWVRIDPTAFVAPERIERGIDVTPAGEGAPVQFRLPGEGRLLVLGRKLGQYWDAVNNGWNQFILGYGPDLQQDFLRHLGLPDVSWRGLGVTLGALAAIAVALNLLWVVRRPRKDPVQALYRQLRTRLGRRGIDVDPGTGPLTLAERAAHHLDPEAARRVADIVQEYVRLRYATPDPANLSPARLKKLLATLD